MAGAHPSGPLGRAALPRRGRADGPGEIADLLRRRGWSILSPPSMSGRHYVANVRNGFGQRLFVVLDAYDGRILDARQIEERPNTNELAAIPGEPSSDGPPR